MKMERPCDNCDTRKAYARMFDMHFFGDDCPYQCDTFDKWKRQQEEQHRETLQKNWEAQMNMLGYDAGGNPLK